VSIDNPEVSKLEIRIERDRASITGHGKSGTGAAVWIAFLAFSAFITLILVPYYF
jgi:hypothetical protein